MFNLSASAVQYNLGLTCRVEARLLLFDLRGRSRPCILTGAIRELVDGAQHTCERLFVACRTAPAAQARTGGCRAICRHDAVPVTSAVGCSASGRVGGALRSRVPASAGAPASSAGSLTVALRVRCAGRGGESRQARNGAGKGKK